MKMIYSYMKSLKFANNLILTFPSNPTLPASLHPTEKPLNQTCVVDQLSSFHDSRKIAESTKVERKSYEEMDDGKY